MPLTCSQLRSLSCLGIKRERVKFILVPDFIHIITQGEGQKSKRVCYMPQSANLPYLSPCWTVLMWF